MIAQESTLNKTRKLTLGLMIAGVIYSIVQIGLYAATIAQVPCSSANSLLTTIMCTYIAQLLTCAVFVYSLATLNMRLFGIILGSLTSIYKLISVIYLGIAGASHLGDCYIVSQTYDIMIAVLCIEFVLMILTVVCAEVLRSRLEAITVGNKSLQNAFNADPSTDRTKANYI